MSGTYGLLSAHARNMGDPNQAAVLLLGTVNHLQVDLTTTSTATMQFPAGALLELQFGANVTVDTSKVVVTAPHFTASVSHGGWLLTADNAAPPLTPGQLLTIDITGFAAPADFDFANLLLTVAWKGLQSDAAGVLTPVPFDGRALSLEPRKSLAPRPTTPLFEINWGAWAGGPMADRAAGGDVAVTAPPVPWPVDPRIAAQKAADDAEAALQPLTDKIEALKDQIDKAEAAATAAMQKVDADQQNGNPIVDIGTYKADTEALQDRSDELDQLKAQLQVAEPQADGANAAYDDALEALKVANESPPVPPPPTPPDPIINRLAFSLKNLGPPLDASAAGAAPHFLISFVTVGDAYAPWRYDALCTDEQAAAAVFKVSGDGVVEWTLEADTSTAQWRLKPTGRFENLESVIVTIDNLVSSLPPFATTMIVAYRDIPGQEDGFIPVNINKSPPWPVVGSFQATPVDAPIQAAPAPVVIYQGEPVTLSWHCWGVPDAFPQPVTITGVDAQGQSILWKANLPSLGELTFTPTQTYSQYTLKLVVPDSPAQAALDVTMGPVSAELSPSDCTIAPGASATLSYTTTNAASAAITPGGPSMTPPGDAILSGTFVVTPPMTTTYTLTAQGLNGPATAHARVALDQGYGDPVWISAGQCLWTGNDDRLQNMMAVPPMTGLTMRQLALTFEELPLAVWEDPNGGLYLVDFQNPDQPPEGLTSVLAIFAYQQWLFAVSSNPSGGGWSITAPGQDFRGGVPLNPTDAPPVKLSDWIGDADVRGAQFRYAPSAGLLMLAKDGRLFSRNRELIATPTPDWAAVGEIRDNVSAFDLDESGQLYFVSAGKLIKATLDASGGLKEEPLCDTPAISTNIAVTGAGVVYWAENGGTEGPILCRFFPQRGRQMIVRLPGPADPGGVCVDRKFRQPH